MCVYVCVHARVCMCVCARECVCVCMCVCVSLHGQYYLSMIIVFLLTALDQAERQMEDSIFSSYLALVLGIVAEKDFVS